MSNIVVILILVAIVVGPITLLLWLERRKRRSIFKAQDPALIKARFEKVVAQSSKADKLDAWFDLLRSFLRKAELAYEFEAPYRCQRSLNLITICLDWAETLIEHPFAEPPTRAFTNKLSMGMQLLLQMKLTEAAEEFSSVWVDEYAHDKAKRVALMGKIWIYDSQGNYAEAASHEFMLQALNAIEKMDGVSLEYSQE